jgi:DNA-binding MarR family transcriptional regulator
MSTDEDSERRPHLGALIRLAAQLMSEQFAGWIADSGFEGIQPAHSAVIQPLWEAPEGLRSSALAQASRITKQSMSALINDLEAGGYIERVDDPDDARAMRVKLTARGRAYARAARAFARSVEADWAKRLGTSRVQALRETLEQLRSSVISEMTDAAERAPAKRARRAGRLTTSR